MDVKINLGEAGVAGEKVFFLNTKSCQISREKRKCSPLVAQHWNWVNCKNFHIQ
jgi:hypothetical protein